MEAPIPRSDLSGNTFWEFRDPLNPQRTRRKLQPAQSGGHISDGAIISPAWHQWLRKAREEPPSMVEQLENVRRMEETKVLAARADERWKNGESLLEGPGKRRDLLEEGKGDEAGDGTKGKANPGAKRGGPGEEWQPESWNPNTSTKR
ncbi:MAG: hypothetical protein M1814_002651 [Vezdaea aestivalis]|nr:MAG: hypothetical protein M1814_002651 [Vezdaea aestivalis]